jgi:hypothetical protein
MAMLKVLESLAPTERAVFVRHEVLEMAYGEIAAAVGKSPAAVRQIALRARDHVVLAAFETTPVWLNGAPAIRVEIDGQVAAVSVVVENGRAGHAHLRHGKPAEVDTPG